MFLSRHQNVGQNHNKSFGNVVKYKYLGTNQIAFMKRFATDQIQAMLAATLFSLLSSRLLRKNLKIKIYKTIILLVSRGVKLGLSYYGSKWLDSMSE